MKFSDKALRLIGRKLLERTDCNTPQDDAETPKKRGLHTPRAHDRKRKATVLNFTKLQR